MNDLPFSRRLRVPLSIISFALGSALAGASPAFADGQAAAGFADPLTLRAHWDDGLRLETADRQFRFQFGGRIQYDWAFLTADDEVKETVGDLDDGTKFRRARLYFSGQMYDHIVFRTEYDFAGGQAGFRDVWVGLRDIPVVGNVRLGRMLEPFALEGTSPNNQFTFIERGLPTAFYPFRNSGVLLHDHALDRRMTWAAGLFMHTDDFGDSDTNSQYSATARLTGLPWYENDGSRWWHVGLSASRRKPDNDEYRFSARPETFVAPRFVDTGLFPADRVDLLGAETILTVGPASLQAEYVRASAALVETEDFPESGDAEFSGYYVYASWFLTGEHRTYNRNTGALGRIRPNRPVLAEGRGPGAWEIAARYSELDLDDGPVSGGHLRDITLGLNWYLSPNTRLAWNYVQADLKDVGKADIVQMRVFLDF